MFSIQTHSFAYDSICLFDRFTQFHILFVTREWITFSKGTRCTYAGVINSGKTAIDSVEAHGMENATTLRRVAEQLISIANEGGWIKIYVYDRSNLVTKAERAKLYRFEEYQGS